MAPPSAVTDYSDANDAKDLLDKIGETVHKKVHGDALQPSKGKLKGTLSLAKFEKNESDPETPNDPCQLLYQYHTNVTVGYDKENPCKNRSDVRFSYTEGAECDKNKIRGSNGKSEGACAPFRRLHLCDQHLEKINRYDKVNNDTLLTDVCLAAKFEAESLKTYRAQYQQTNSDVNINICTELARSFADIGDIIRGKDLYRGNDRENIHLENQLKQYFKKIYNKLEDIEVRKHYEDAKGNYYQLRNAWWEANRQEVWKAITCGAAGGKYFRKTCSNDQSWTNHNCRCKTNDVPTYFDYVPQYLRWFEEWAEDFCRKNKKYVDIVKTNCRGQDKDGKDLYCSGNGLDCQETIRAIGKFVLGQHCTKCSFLCGRYKKWIDNQKQEFLKQKNKCENEMLSKSKKKQSTKYNVYEGYDKEFYDEFKSNNVGGLDKFLDLLNKEEVCTKFSKDLGKIDFKNVDGGGVGAIGGASDSNNSNKTFSHSEYCEECPQCGVEKKSNGEFQEKRKKKSGKCDGKKLYEIPIGTNHNVIPVLSFGDKRDQIKNKINTFCTKKDNDREMEELTEKWKCYYGHQQYEACTLDNKNKENSANEPDEIQKSFNDFFYFWIGHLLNDSIEWRDKVNSCINKAKEGKCKNECNTNCKCFLKWIDKKKTEWKAIKEHFNTQKGIPGGWTHYELLKYVLNIDELFKDITEAYGNSQEIQGIKDTLAKKKNQETPGATEQKNTIDLLFEYDSEEADKCKQIQEECQPKKPTKVRNPCYGNNTYDALAGKVAQKLQQEAKEQLDRNDSRSALKGNPSQGHYNGRNSGNDLEENICSIDKTYSNAESNKSNNPCDGKHDGRFNIGEEWQNGSKIQFPENDYMPPRRQHICTSNVEHLLPPKDGHFYEVPNNKATHSLLGDVLIAAKKEGEDIKTKLTKNDNRSSICRTMKYSFADIGDIIRGKDLWYHTDQTQLQRHLKTIFGKIKTQLKDQLNDKYDKDDDKHTKLRKDWWEANRETVWDAMTCPTKNGNIQCGATPYDDYIPQRLRWMVEWAEWFCKAQAEAYGELLRDCGSCTTGKCNNDKCAKCDKQCQEYKNKIQEWEDQWKVISRKYETLYSKAKIAAINGGTDNSTATNVDKDKNVIDFLQKLHEANYGTRGPPPEAHPGRRPRRAATSKSDVYETTAGYIHQEARTGECLGQNVFCNNNGNKEYAFSLEPHEYKGACKCKDRPQQEDGGSVGRNETHNELQPQSPADSAGDDDGDSASDDENTSDEEDEEEEEGDANEEEEENVAEVTEVTEVNPCDIVADLFSDTTKFSDACTLKYGGNNSRLGWKCIPTNTNDVATERTGRISKRSTPETATSSDNKGGLCIPPRRRRLYVGKLHDWAEKQVGEAQPQASEAAQGNGDDPQKALLKAFVESAAVETFFLWDRYKKIKDKERQEKEKREREESGLLFGTGTSVEMKALDGAIPGGIPPVGMTEDAVPQAIEVPGADSDDPEHQLKQGIIPEEFKRQMFYTLGDYRDICVGVEDDVIKELKASADEKIEELQNKIKEHINSVSKPSVQTPESWWDKNAQHIWEGMICALTYKENGSNTEGGDGKTTTITQDTDLKDALLDKDGKKPKKEDYKYEKMELKEENSDTEARTGSPGTSGEKTTLTDFISRPTYFRYLEEWGQNFCVKRERIMKKLDEECRGVNDGGDPKYCSGDGHYCDETRTLKTNNFIDLHCSRCAEQCRNYRKWIDIKFEEFQNQKTKYEGELQKLEHKSSGNGDNKNFYTSIKDYKSVDEFLTSLKHCKNSEDDTDKSEDDKKNKIDFEHPEKTFSPSTYCKACPVYGVTCNGVGRSRIRGTSGCKPKDEPQKAANTEDGEPTTIPILINDGSNHSATNGATGTTDETLKDCSEKYNFFKRLRKQEWTCQNKKGIDQCKCENFENDTYFDKDIVFNEFFQRWLRYFIYDYNKLKHKIDLCIKMEDGTEHKCITACKKNCDCVRKWLEIKEREWKKIKEHYGKHSNDDRDTIASSVKSYFEQLHFDSDYKRAQEVVETPCEKQQLWGCTGDNLDGNEKNCKDDFITNLIKKLTEKIGQCQSKHNGTDCSETALPQMLEDETLDDDIQTEEVKAPNICPQLPKPQPEEPEGECKAAESPSKDKKEGESTPAPPEPPPPPRPRPQPKPLQPALPPALKNAMLSSTIMWSVGIGFATFTYFFLKKKTKASVGNLFQILQIPKSDYDIPTKLSPNRYIPYTSGKYRGKRYIYLEGDSGTDSGYTDHYSDITSSESEYEELDINDIYAPRAPKYKTLIEVVLEPSGNNTTASGNNTPSDTQNDIQNDGIPSSKITDNEWNKLKKDFISNMLQNEPNTEPNILHDNLDNNTHPTPSHNKLDQKPFITSIHDRNLLSGEEYNYDMSNNSGIYPSSSNRDSLSGTKVPYSGIDLINDSLSGGEPIDIYDEVLKRKENELFGTKHPKRTTTNHFATPTRDDPLHNQLNLFHKWLDRHRDMCEKWKNKEDILNKLKEEWDSDKLHTPIDDIPSDNKTLNTDVSIQIDMDNPKTKNEITNMDTNPDKSTMDTILDDLEKYNEPYYYDFYEDDIIYHDVDVEKSSMDDIYVDHNNVTSNNMDVPTKMHIEMNIVNNKNEIFEEEYPISDIWNI